MYYQQPRRKKWWLWIVIPIILYFLIYASFLSDTTPADKNVKPCDTYSQLLLDDDVDFDIDTLEATYNSIKEKHIDTFTPPQNQLSCYNQLNDEEKQMYQRVAYAVQNFDFLVLDTNDYTDDKDEMINELTMAELAYYYDNPQCYWTVFSGDRVMTLGTYYCAQYEYYFSDEEVGYTDEELNSFLAEKEQFDQALDTMLADVKAQCDGMDQWHTALTVYKYVCDNVSYDYDLVNEVTHSQLDDENTIVLNGSIYSAVVNGTSVCRGYCQLYDYLLNSLGISCSQISGKVDASKSALYLDNNGDIAIDKDALVDPFNDDDNNHIWNIALIDGEYCNIDTTFGDFDDENLKYNMAYFCASDSEIALTHTRGDYFDMPECTSNQNSFFVHEGLYKDSLNSNDIDFAISYALQNDLNYAAIKYSTNQLLKDAHQRYFVDSLVAQNALTKYDRQYDDKINIDDMGYYMSTYDDDNNVLYIYLWYTKE